MPSVTMTLDEYLALVGGSKTTTAAPSTSSRKIAVAPSPKRTRKVSAYQRRFGIELKKLKKAHPRTAIGTLMKRAHRATKKVMK